MHDSGRTASPPPAWTTGPATPRLGEGEVHVWRARLSTGTAPYEGLLSAAERARAARFRFERDADRYVVARGLLRTLLGRYRERPPESLRLEETEHGRPYDADGTDGLDFNLSHSEDRALFAFTRAGRVGVDLEWIQPLPDMAELVEINFSPAEQAVWRALPAARRERAFFDCWTRKEAFVKAVGEGLSHPLDAFDVTLAPGEPPAVTRLAGGDPARWTLCALDAAAGHAAALAVEARDVRLVCFEP